MIWTPYITGVAKDMEIWDEETFGSSAAIFVAKNDEETISIANDSAYGLNAAVLTTNMQRAIEIGRRLEVAQVLVNSMTEHSERTPTLLLDISGAAAL